MAPITHHEEGCRIHRDKLSFTREYAGSTRNVIINVLLGKSAAGAMSVADITETRKANLQLHASEQAFRTVVETRPMSSCAMTGKEGAYT